MGSQQAVAVKQMYIEDSRILEESQRRVSHLDLIVHGSLNKFCDIILGLPV